MSNGWWLEWSGRVSYEKENLTPPSLKGGVEVMGGANGGVFWVQGQRHEEGMQMAHACGVRWRGWRSDVCIFAGDQYGGKLDSCGEDRE